MRRFWFRFFCSPVLVLMIVSSAPAAEPAKPVDFAAQIQPIFAKHCTRCHGPKKQESGLRLDAGAFILKGGDRGAVVVPGKSGESPLHQAITGTGDTPQMPAEAAPLADELVALIRQWIDEGAKTPKETESGEPEVRSDHWAFQPIRRRQVPAASSAAALPGNAGKHAGPWVRNSIDNFVLARLEQEGLRPSPEADRETLIRRLSLDLRGLPPTVAEIDEFLADQRPGAYERLVDRLLASPHFGERWGRHWLDVARYADSNGFTIDGPRSIWKYRDWVIDAFNRDLPFDEFTIQQLAGDLLANATTDQLIATGFHRNTLINQEGGTDQEQFRVEAIVDRVNTTGTAWLGLTIGCAQCHQHKYDPISQRDFYELFAIFNNCDEPTIQVPSPEQTTALKQLDAEIAVAEQPLREHDAELIKGFEVWQNDVASRADSDGTWTVLDPLELSTEKGAVLAEQPDQSIFVDFSIPPTDTYTVVAETGLKEITAIRLEALTHPSLPNMGPGRAENGNFVLSEFEVSVAAPDSLSRAASGRRESPDSSAGSRRPLADIEVADVKPARVELAKAIADHSQEGYPVAHAIDGKTDTGWAINVQGGSLNVDREAVFFPKKPLRGEAGARLVVRLGHAHSAAGYLLGRFRLSASSAPPEQLAIPASIRKILAVPANKRTKAQQDSLVAAYLETDPARKPLAEKVAGLKKRREQLAKAIPTTMVLGERKQPRETHIHLRGDFLRKGARVTGDVPDVLPGLPKDVDNPTRLDLARWLVDPDNPLTARVTVNRLWQRLFGLGLVETENDFGLQGTPPSHPELLDFLAAEFMAPATADEQRGFASSRRWSIKSLLRLIVTSATYRQSSQMRPELLRRDPTNRLLARQSRLRLEAEIIRDVSLAASGLLTREIGGPGVHPPQPEGIYVLTQVKKPWPEEQGPDRYRRGMYTYFWRSSPYPLLPTFDAPEANTTCTRRVRSNTPLQALTLANDRAFVELAAGLANRLLRDGPHDAESRLRFAFRLCLGREPNEPELRRLAEFLQSQREFFESNAEQAKTAAPASRPEDASTAEAAAWTAVARVLLNLDEFITRE